MDDQQHAKKGENDDQGDRHGTPTLGPAVMTVRLVLLQRRNWTGGATSTRFRRQRVLASHRADGFSTTESPSGLAGACGARIRTPGRSLWMRLVQMVRAGRSTATYRTAAFVRLVSKGAPFPASDQRRTARVRFPALAERAIVLVHHQSPLAVEVALHFRTDFLACLVDQHAVVRRLVENLRSFAGAHRAASLVFREVAVQATVRQFGADFVGIGTGIVVAVLLGLEAAADGTIVLPVGVSMLAGQRASFQGRPTRRLRLGKGGVGRWWTMRTTLARIRWNGVLAGFTHRLMTGHSVFLANAALAVRLLPSFAHLPRLVLVYAVFRRFRWFLAGRLYPRHRFCRDAIVTGATATGRIGIRWLHLQRSFTRRTFDRWTAGRAFAFALLSFHAILRTFGSTRFPDGTTTEDQQCSYSRRSHDGFPFWNARDGSTSKCFPLVTS